MKVVCCFLPSEAESPRGVDGGAFSFRSCNVGGESDSPYDSNMGLAGAVAEAKEDGKPSERCQGLQSQPCKLNLFSNDSKQNYMLKVCLPIKLSTNMSSFTQDCCSFFVSFTVTVPAKNLLLVLPLVVADRL
ncbi:uncharacterized protein LOC130739870 isoform X5 [Lotus japonicus]|uniref:uncharacterized protein LOC130739870 isoform X5 n=1 Tax=Lotus japonicus TaxID=34305 RepID=UPI0025843A4C|nr:uncharacterized protein LOC130739870 isoform X5 [Lotus japonicus]